MRRLCYIYDVQSKCNAMNQDDFKIVPYTTVFTKDNLPEIHLGVLRMPVRSWGLVVKQTDGVINLHAINFLRCSAANGDLLYEVEGQKLFTIAPIEKGAVLHISCDLIRGAFIEFNDYLNKRKSSLTYGIDYPVPIFKDIYPHVAAAFSYWDDNIVKIPIIGN